MCSQLIIGLFLTMIPTKAKIMFHSIFFVVLAIFYQSQSFSEPQNLHLLKSDIRQYHDSGEYQKEFKHVVKQAETFIINTANAYNKLPEHKQPAVVFDIDETTLSNYNNIEKYDFTSDKAQILTHIRKAESTCLKESLSLYQHLLQHHIAIFFVTGRHLTEKEATIRNLKQEGYTAWKEIYFRPDTDKAPSAIPYKSSTRALIEKNGYQVIATIGDQYSDIKGGHALKGFKLPNPFYYLP
jgi:acid phosphatase